MVAILVTLSHQFQWEWLRFLTSEVVLRISAFLGMETQRLSFATIRVRGEVFCFVISCTFVDVFAGMIPLVWNLKKSMFRNLLMLNVFAVNLFAFNIFRLEIAHLLHASGVPWILVDDVLGGLAYFVIWFVVMPSGVWSELKVTSPQGPKAMTSTNKPSPKEFENEERRGTCCGRLSPWSLLQRRFY